MTLSFTGLELFVLSSVVTVYSANNDGLASVGDTAQLKCADNVTKTSIVIIWERNGESVLNHDLTSALVSSDKLTSRVIEEKSTVMLEIQNVSLKDAGNYSCIWYLKSGIPDKKHMSLRVQGYPSLSLNSNATVEGDFLQANCCVQFAPLTVGEELCLALEDTPHADARCGITTSTEEGEICNTFKVQSSRDYNDKHLRCYVKNQPKHSTNITLDVLYPATVEILGTTEKHVLRFALQSALNITCVADGNPVPSVTLEREKGTDTWETTTFTFNEIVKDENIKVSSFIREKVKTDDKGWYRCCVYNMDVNCNRFYVDITVPATIQMLMPPSIKIDGGGEVVISCQTEGNPEPKVDLQQNYQGSNWRSLSTTPIPIFRQDLVSTWMFRLDDQKMDFSGTYRCVGYNGVGDRAISGEVIVELQSGITPSYDNAANPVPVTVVAVICVSSVIAFIVAIVTLRLLLRRKCFNRTKSRAGRYLPQLPKEAEIVQEYEENLELYHTIKDDNTGYIAEHIEVFTKDDIKFISNIKRDAYFEKWLGKLKKPSQFASNGNVCVSFSSGKDKTTLQLFSRHLHFIVKLPRNEHIVTTLGTFEEKGIAYSIQEYLPSGNLRTFLETEYGQSYIYGNTVEPIPQEFVTFALDVVSGLEFLRYHGWIHPGLCAQRVLLDNKQKRCKLYDFCHMCNKTDKVNILLTKKPEAALLHMAPEVTQRATVLAKDGKKCYTDIQNQLLKPSNCPRQLYDVMVQCWVFDPLSRPTFIDLEGCLKSTAETYQITFVKKDDQTKTVVLEQETYAREIHSS